MADHQKYATLLLEISELLQKKNTYIEIKDFECERLKQKLNLAEQRIIELQKGNENE